MRNAKYSGVIIIYSFGTLLIAYIFKAVVYNEEAKARPNYPFIINWWPVKKEDERFLTYLPIYYNQVISSCIYMILGIFHFLIIFNIICALSRQGTSRTLYRRVCIRYLIFFMFTTPFYADRIFVGLSQIYDLQFFMENAYEFRQMIFLTAFFQTMTCVCEPFVLRTFTLIIRNDLKKQLNSWCGFKRSN